MFKAQLRELGLEVVSVAGDGNCLFRALAEHIFGTEDAHDKVRADILNYMKLNRGRFEHFNETGLAFDEYIHQMKQPGGGWGGEMELHAAAVYYGVDIQIFRDSGSTEMEPPYILVGSRNRDTPPITLSYHNGNHYNSVRPLDCVRQEQPLDAKSEPKDAKEAEEMNASCCCASILLQCKRSITRKRKAEDGRKETKGSSKR